MAVFRDEGSTAAWLASLLFDPAQSGKIASALQLLFVVHIPYYVPRMANASRRLGVLVVLLYVLTFTTTVFAASESTTDFNLAAFQFVTSLAAMSFAYDYGVWMAVALYRG